ncbi:MAG: porin family protein [Alphaproteobacteria bacterium]|jgi:opacity protein-like surface antigen|nr:porin family protein [Alphaproteobacteria bacterium]
MKRLSVLAFVILLAASFGAGQSRADELKSADATWYFIGDSNSPWARLDRDAREPFLSLGEADELAARHEFVLTLSDDSNPERLRFTAGQSLALSGRTETYTFLVNRSFDWSNDSPITPHFMAGLGMTYTDDQGVADLAGRGAEDDATWRPAFQFGFGASYEISTNWALVAQYRALMVGAESFALDGDGDAGFTQNFMIGARIKF